MLLAELRRIGPEGRKKVVEEWSPYLPTYVDPASGLTAEGPGSSAGSPMGPPAAAAAKGALPPSGEGATGEGIDEDEEDDDSGLEGSKNQFIMLL